MDREPVLKDRSKGLGPKAVVKVLWSIWCGSTSGVEGYEGPGWCYQGCGGHG